MTLVLVCILIIKLIVIHELSKITDRVKDARRASLIEQSNTSNNLEIILNIVNTINKTLIIDDVLELVLKKCYFFNGY